MRRRCSSLNIAASNNAPLMLQHSNIAASTNAPLMYSSIHYH
jgi:hypothetical protein